MPSEDDKDRAVAICREARTRGDGYDFALNVLAEVRREEEARVVGGIVHWLNERLAWCAAYRFRGAVVDKTREIRDEIAKGEWKPENWAVGPAPATQSGGDE